MSAYANHILTLKRFIWLALTSYFIYVAIYGWGPWDRYYSYSYTLPRSVAVGGLLFAVGNFIITFFVTSRKNFWIDQLTLGLLVLVASYLLNEQRRLKNIIAGSDEMEITGQWIDLRKSLATVKNPQGFEALAKSLKLVEDTWYKGQFYFCPDKFIEYRVDLRKSGRTRATLYLISERAVRWRVMNDDVDIHPEFLDQLDFLLQSNGFKSLNQLRHDEMKTLSQFH